MDDLWRLRAPGVEASSAKAQLLCLPTYLGDPSLAGRVSFAWFGLSRACHHGGYALPPSATDLINWIEVAEELAERVGAGCVAVAETRAAGSPTPPGVRDHTL